MTLKRLPLIRHLRYFWLRREVHAWAQMCARIGLGLGHPNPTDLDHLDAVWRGRA